MFWVSLLLTLLWTTSSWAQSNPGFISGATLCANTGCPGSTNPLGLNQAFMLKQDLLGGGTPIVGTTAFTGGSVVPFSTPVPPVSGVWLSGTTSPGILYTQAGYSGLQNYAQELVQYVTTQPNAIAEVGLVVDALFKTGYSATNTAATAYKAAMTLSSRVCGVGGV